MMAKMKAFFAQELEKDICPWRDLAECLFFALKNTQLFKEEKVLVKVKQTEKAEATFKFKVFFFLKATSVLPQLQRRLDGCVLCRLDRYRNSSG